MEIVLPEEITIEEATKINTDSMKYEGVEAIKEDGTLIITDKASEIGKELLGVEWKEIPIADIEYFVDEGLKAYESLADKYGTPASFY